MKISLQSMLLASCLVISIGCGEKGTVRVGAGGAAGSRGSGGTAGHEVQVANTGGSSVGGEGGLVSAGLGGAGGGGVNACGERRGASNNFTVLTDGPWATTPARFFEGAAIVERSTVDSITVYYEPDKITNDPGGASGLAGYHATIYNRDRGHTPVLPVGANLWMTKYPDKNQTRDVLAYGVDPWSVSLRDRQGGTLLLEAVRGITLKRTVECSGWVNACQPGVWTYYSVEVPADSPVVLNDGASAVIQRGGRSYDVHVSSETSPPSGGHSCQDYHQVDTTCLDLNIRALTDLTFDMATPPACIPGNDRTPAVSFYIADSSSFDGRITYRGPNGRYFIFETDAGSEVEIFAEEVLAEPAPGQQLWLTNQGAISALRMSQHGELLVAGIGYGNWDAIPAILGISATAENDCAYTMTNSGVTYLKRVVFGSTPPVTVRDGAQGILPLGGMNYRVANAGGTVTIWK